MYDIVKLIHILTTVFMSVPLYNLIVVHERGRLGTGVPVDVDRYFENIIRGGAMRCFVFQLTILVTGLYLVVDGLGFVQLWENPFLLAKLLVLVVLISQLAYVTFSIQPRIDRQVATVSGSPLPEGTFSIIGPLRLRRKRLAAICLLLLMTEIILGVQVKAPFGATVTIVLEGLAVLFAWRAYRSGVRFGWA